MGSTNWGIAAICFAIGVIIFGTARLAGLLYVATIHHFSVSREQASLPFALSFTVRNVAGPLIGYLGRRFGSKAVTIYGCLLSSIGVGACFLAEDIIVVILCWGVIFGLGLGLSTTLLLQVINEHFDKHRDKAYGFYLASDCFGAFVIPLLTEVLLSTYGVAGTFLILSAVVLNCIPAAMLIRNHKTDAKAPKHIPDSLDKKVNKDQDLRVSINNDFKNIRQELSGEYLDKASFLDVSNELENESIKTAIKASGSLNLPNKLLTVDRKGSVVSLSNSIVILTNKKNFDSKSLEMKQPLCQSLFLFMDPTFILILITQSTSVYITITISIIVIDFGRDVGVTAHQDKYILMCLAISDIIGKFAFGFVTDGGFIRKTTFAAICYFITGTVLTVATWLQGFEPVIIIIFIFGTMYGGISMISPGIILQSIEEENVTMALSSRYFLFPFMSISQSPLIGFFREKKNSYDGVLYIVAALSFLSAFLALLIPTTVNLRQQKKEKVCLEKQDRQV